MINLDNLDLNLNNYSFEDILDLYNLDYNFNNNDLKNVKKKIILLHPDKSGLDQKYFIFFKKSYEILLNIYSYQNLNPNNEIKKLKEDINENPNEKNLSQLFKTKSSEEFNMEFNKMFDKLYLKDENEKKGYSDWLTSDNDFLKTEEDVNKIKENSIIQYDSDILSYNHDSFKGTYNYDNLSNYNVDNNDLKRVYYDETIIPINEKEVYLKSKKYNNLNELNNERGQIYDNIKYNHLDSLYSSNSKDQNRTLKLAYNMYKKQEQYNSNLNKEISNYLLIKK